MRSLVTQTVQRLSGYLDKLRTACLCDVAVHQLMGGAIDEEWVVHVDKPWVLVGTQDQLLSRALNRGYSMSRFEWPVHFGLLNNDCRWLIDEVQLMGPGLWTTSQLDWMRRKRFESLKPCPTTWMSATVGTSFLSTTDRVRDALAEPSNEQIAFEDKLKAALDGDAGLKWWRAAKRPLAWWQPEAGAQPTTGGGKRRGAARSAAATAVTPNAIAASVKAKHVAGTLSLVICNTVEMARAAFGALSSVDYKVLLTSRFRREDRARHEQRLLDFDAKRKASALPEHDPGLICVSTQVIEAGVIERGIAGYTLERLAALEVRDLVGKTLFVDVRLGGLDHGLLEAKEDAVEVDVGDGRTTRFTLQTSTATDGSKDWRRVFTAPVKVSDDGDIERYLVVDQQSDKARPNEEGLSVSSEQTLTDHQRRAQEEARRIGDSLRLPPDDIEMLATAAVHHDDGKASLCWQSAFHAPVDKQPLAKVGKWIDQSILGGYRHEAGSLLGLMGKWDVFPDAKASVAMSQLSAERQELGKHLVSSHHGWSRPTLPVVGIEVIPPSKLADLQHEVAERFAVLQETWGPWGLAWWEALLRAADGIASRRNDAKGGGS